METKEEKIYFYVYDKEDTYGDNECYEVYEDEEEAIDFCINENAAYGYQKFYYEKLES